MEKEVKALRDFFKNTPKEEIQKIVDKVSKKKFEGPTVTEYFENFGSQFIRVEEMDGKKIFNKKTIFKQLTEIKELMNFKLSKKEKDTLNTIINIKDAA